jgi:cell division protein FtsB
MTAAGLYSRRHGHTPPTSPEGRHILPPRLRRSLTRRRLLALSVAVAGAWVSYAVYAATAAGHALDGQVRALRSQNAALRQEVELRRRQLTAATSAGWLEEEARRLGYVRPGERIFVLATPGTKLPAYGGVDPGPLPSAATPTPRPAAMSTPTVSASPAAVGAAPVTPGPTPLQFTVPRR